MIRRIFAVSFLLGGLHYTVYGAGIPREIALDNLPKNIEFVRHNMNSNADRVGVILVSQMAVPIGDRPEVLALFEEVIAKSTNPASVQLAASALELSVSRHRKQINSKKYPEIAAALKQALAKVQMSLSVRVEIAGTLPLLGNSYKDDSYRLHLDILAHPRGPMDSHDEPGLLLRAVDETLRFNRPDSREVLLQAVSANHIREYIDAQLAQSKGATAQKYYGGILERLDTLEKSVGENKKGK